MTDASLAQRIRHIQETSSLVDPHELADKVLDGLTDKQLRAVLAEALPSYVRQVLRDERRHAIANVGHASAPVQQASRRVAAVHDWRTRLLATSIDVSGAEGRWKRLGECTRDDLLAVVAHRRDVAARNTAVADQYNLLADHLTEGQTVAGLPDDVLQAAFRSGARR